MHMFASPTMDTTLTLIALDAPTASLVQESARLVFPAVSFIEFPSLAAACEQSDVKGGLLVVDAEKATGLEEVQKAVDADSLSRWGIVLLGANAAVADETGITRVPKEGQTTTLLAPLLKSAATLHAMQRENQRLRGDLRTVARRITHDLRSPLSGIVSTGDMLKELLSETEPQAGEFAAPLFRSVDHLVKLIERFGILLNASAQPLLPGKVLMGDAVANALQRLEYLCWEKKITIQRPAEWPEVQGVQSWIEPMWWNLAHNAVQHTPGVKHVEVGWDRMDDGYRFWVRDDGPGVPPERRAKLFQPFNMLHEPGASKGLGLTTVQRFAELQGGKCGYEALEGGGSRFWFWLPAVR